MKNIKINNKMNNNNLEWNIRKLERVKIRNIKEKRWKYRKIRRFSKIDIKK